MTDRPFLGLCMIVRDASKTIDALLESVKGNFDEYVFVDTGSVDDTVDRICRHFGDMEVVASEGRSQRCAQQDGSSVVFATFDWIDDFAAARNYSYSLSTAKWKCYLDADDTFEDSGKKDGGYSLREAIKRLEERNPSVNAISIGYAYAKDDTQQDVVHRITRHDDENVWTWEDEVHEHLVERTGRRLISQFVDRCVIHHRPPETNPAAFARNKRIAERVYNTPNLQGEKKARFAYHLAQSAKFEGELNVALMYLSEVVMVFGEINLGAYAYSDMVRILLEKGELDQALEIAGQMQARLPEHREADMLAGLVQVRKKSWGRAATLFDQAFAKGNLPLQSLEDVWFTRGYIPALAAETYLELGRDQDAERMLASIPRSISLRDDVLPHVSKAQAKLMKRKGMKVLKDFVDYLIWDTEPIKALKVLQDAVPAAIQSEAEISRMQRALKEKLPHLEGWEEYQEAYASIPDETYHTASHVRDTTMSLYRAQHLLEWVKELPKDGPPLRMCSIGFQDGIIEREVMEANPRIHLTVVDTAPQASEGYKMLRETFGERVDGYTMTRGHYDWWGDHDDKYDVVVMFEVLEHLPDVLLPLGELRGMLKDDGTLFLSTPVAARWVEPYLTDPELEPDWYGHVRAHNHVSLWRLLSPLFDGLLVEGYDGVFLAQMQKKAKAKYDRGQHVAVVKGHVAIVVPGTPNPFGPFTHISGFLGGSEECVVHLSAELAHLGWQVTVFAPETDGYPIVRGYDGVLWRPIEEFDNGDDHGAVLFWRSAAIMPPPSERPYKALLWLHDAAYNAPPREYEKADEVIVLSKAHGDSIARYDGFKGPFTYLANGILEESFPDLGDDAQRDPHKLIYASSPDRGLERIFDMWTSIRQRYPDATLDIYYDWSGYKRMFPLEHANLCRRLNELESHGVTYHGGVPHAELHEAFRRASIWAYPNAGDVETFCITAAKAMASGCYPITSSAGALPEIVGDSGGLVIENVNDQTIDTNAGRKTFLDAVLASLWVPPPLEMRKRIREQALERFGWKKVAQRFSDVISSRTLVS